MRSQHFLLLVLESGRLTAHRGKPRETAPSDIWRRPRHVGEAESYHRDNKTSTHYIFNGGSGNPAP